MIHFVLNDKSGKPVPADGSSAAQLRREAGKARKLADAAFGEQERRQLIEVAAALEREAAEIDSVLGLKPGARS